MDKPDHPIVIQPWKIRQIQRTKRDVAQIKVGKERGRLVSKAPNILTSRKSANRGSKKKS